MADKEPADDGPSLELPSFGFGRRKRGERAEASEPEVPVSPDPGPEVVPGAAPDVPASPPAPDPAPEIDPLIPTRPEHEPPSRPRPTPEPSPEREPEPGTDPEPDPQPEPAPFPDPGPLPDPDPLPEPRDTPTAVLPVTGDTAAAPSVGSTRLHERAQPVDEPGRRTIRFPSLPALPAVLLVGAVVGLTAVLLTWASLRLCDAATGTTSCGGGPGLLMLLAILIALTYLGGWLLRGFGIGDAGSTSFLAVGLLAVVAMLFLVDSLDEWSGVGAVLVVTVVAYALSWRVTAMLVDAGADQQ